MNSLRSCPFENWKRCLRKRLIAKGNVDLEVLSIPRTTDSEDVDIGHLEANEVAALMGCFLFQVSGGLGLLETILVFGFLLSRLVITSV
jgi:hypothetical protein